MKNRILSLLLALGLVFALAVHASAADVPVEMPDLTKKGSLEFTMDVDGVPLNTGFLNMYYVAGIFLVEDDRYDFRLVQTLADAGAKLDTKDLYHGVQAKNLLKVADRVDRRSVLAAVSQLFRLVELHASVPGRGFLCGAGGQYR